jgi:hypothetical protein
MHATQNPVSPATHPGIADTLRRAALYLIRHGWTQDTNYAKRTTPVIPGNPMPAADVIGALVLATTGRTLIPGEILRECGLDATCEFYNAVDYLTDWLGLSDEIDYASDKTPQRLLWDWNDAPWQDQAHVVDGLLCAAADADGTVYLPDSHRPYAADFAALGLTSGGAR